MSRVVIAGKTCAGIKPLATASLPSLHGNFREPGHFSAGREQPVCFGCCCCAIPPPANSSRSLVINQRWLSHADTVFACYGLTCLVVLWFLQPSIRQPQHVVLLRVARIVRLLISSMNVASLRLGMLATAVCRAALDVSGR